MKFSFKWLALGLVAFFILYLGSAYNGLIKNKIKVDSEWSQVQNIYQSRFDLIPNLQATVKGASNFEQSTFIGVTEARTKWLNASNSNDRQGQLEAAQQFDSAFSRLLVSVEAYPQLTATATFQALNVQIEGMENRVRVARRDYTKSVEQYNTYVETFPRIIIAKLFGFESEPFFTATNEAQSAPKVNFD